MTIADPQSPGALAQLALFLQRKGRPVWQLTVLSKHAITPKMMRVIFSLANHAEFSWRHGQDLVLELPQPDGAIARRHYTIRAGKPKEGALAIDFVRHGQSLAGAWLGAAKAGDRINAVGPRGHTYLREADWHLFVGDETALPAIFAMLESLAPGVPAFAFLEVADDAERQGFGGAAQLIWLPRDGAPAGPSRRLSDAVEGFTLPPGRGHAYILGETGNVRAIRQHLIARGLAKEQICAEGYWRPGRIGGHDHA